MQWNDDQAQALDALRTYMCRGNRYENGTFVLAGLAGTGKTTLISAFLKEMAENGEKIALVAPTGKAAAVLNSKQNIAVAQTIHSLVYGAPHDPNIEVIEHIERLERRIDAHNSGLEPHPNIQEIKDELQKICDKATRSFTGQGELQFVPKDPAEILDQYGFTVIVCDEASMVAPEEVGRLADLQLPTIYLGDPNQLFPVGYTNFAVPLDRPTAKLTQIMRQTNGSPILDLSRKIIAAGGMPRGVRDMAGIRAASGTNPLPLMFDADTKCITYLNATRRSVNEIIRNAYHGTKVSADFPYLPFIGEKLMINANRREHGVMKGDEITITEICKYGDGGPVSKYLAEIKFRDHRGTEKAMSIWLNDMMLSVGHSLGMEKPAYGDKIGFQAFKNNFIASKQSVDVAFPYAITCHKSQGSEWESVLVFNEGHKAYRQQYLYTAVTRARENLALAGVY